jgi:hypothetical protein
LKLVYEGPADSKAGVAKKAEEIATEKEPNRRLIVGLVIIGLFFIAYVIGSWNRR